MSKAIDKLLEQSATTLILDALSRIVPQETVSKLATEALGSVTVSERPQIPGENELGFLPLTVDYYNNTNVSIGQLRAIRDISRLLYYGNEIMRNAILNRTNFVVGEGLTYRILPKNVKTSPKELVKYALDEKEDTKISQMMANWTAFTEKNDFNKRLRDWNQRAHRDGEAIIRIFNTKDVPTIRFIYPDYLEAKDANSPQGILFDANDSETAVEYYVRYPNNVDSKTVPADSIIFDKRNVDMESYRGLPTGYSVFSNVRRIEKLLVNVSVLAQIQSAIALIRKHENSTGAQVSKFLDKNTTGKAIDPVTGELYRNKNLRAGTVLDAPKGTSYDMPAHNIDTMNFIQVIDKELAHVAAGFLVPVDWLLAVEKPEPINPGSPTYQSILTERADLFSKVTELFWTIQQLMGLDSNKLRSKYELCIEGPDIPVAKAIDQARIDETYQRVGATSPQEIATRKGWNYIFNRIETIRHRATQQPGEQMPGDAGATNTGGGDGQTKSSGALKENNASGGNTKV